MDYSAAAHHAPTTTDPTPDPALLSRGSQDTFNPAAPHVHVPAPDSASAATATAAEAQASVVPQKRESDHEDAKTSSTPASTTTTASKNKKKKKAKKHPSGQPKQDGDHGDDDSSEGDKAKAQDNEQKRKADEAAKKQQEQEAAAAKEQEETERREQQQQKDKEEKQKKEQQEKERAEQAKKDKNAKDQQAVEQSNGDKKSLKSPVDGKDNDKKKPGSGFKTELEDHPSMQDRPTVPADLDDKLADPYVARANIAATVESPDGTQTNNYADEHKDESVLQQHVAFFDRDSDGIIWPTDTFIGFHNLGYAAIWCLLAVFLIHPTFSYFTLDSWFPDPFFRISVKNIHRAKHGSDTGTYDTQGRFVPAKFEAIFTKFDQGNKGGLTFLEGLSMIRENRNVLDPVGWIGAFFEWFASYLLIWPKNGLVSKEDLRTVYDGSLFYAVAEKENTTRSKQHLPWSGLFKENRAKDVAKLKSH